MVRDADLLVPGVLYRRDPVADPVPLVVDSPHSGVDWPADFEHRVTLAELMTSVDAYVDELFGAVPAVGGTLLAALFPRAYVDPNRAEDDLDARLIDGDWPHPLNPTRKTAAGMGVIRRLILEGRPLYDRPLPAERILHRLETFHRPYHSALAEAVARTHARHGVVFHLNVHSMKPVGNAMNVDAGRARPDVVLSDREGATCDPAFIGRAVEVLRDLGYRVSVNDPYKGAELVRRHSDPAGGRHSLQLELNRALYLDPQTFDRSTGFARLKADLDTLLADLADWTAARAG
ncbi:N-formylglutamate amidohydrolase [Thalassobaculum fulvum]|uniref:N-formylglutamate amidohydrolase n=1 Tax=Thalassobaculum fulvum TaxID=1633335 RepID=A0A919CRC7_9PROT|nr:N-formylglutamate amidohydrolase [Thalassobaculum fulvum]